jgi:hypothetical protein
MIWGQGARNGHALALPARELAGQVGGLVSQAHGLEQFFNALAPQVARHPGQHQRVFDVLERVEHGQQVEVLKNEAQVSGPEIRQLIARHLLNPLARHHDLTLVGAVNAADQVQQSGFAATGGP